MSFSLFIARRIYSGKEVGKQVSKPAVRIATLGIAIGLMVMIVSVAVVIGFKDEIRSKVIGFGSHIQISNFDSSLSYETRPVVTSDSIIKVISSIPGVKHVQRYSTKPGMIKTDDAFQGMVLKGVGQEFDPTFFRQHLIEGEIPAFSDSSSTNAVVISKSLANKLRLKLGDKIYTYYIQNEVRARRLTIKGIYQTNFSEYDNLFLLTDIRTVNHLNQWEPEQTTGLEIQVNNYDELDQVASRINRHVDKEVDKYGGVYYVQTVKQLNPSVFAWLSLLDMNVWVILILMLGVAGFTMISGLLIIILERTNMIGILKALGAKNFSIREIFLYFSVFLIGKGMLWGNVVGLLFCFIQSKFQIFKLNPETYYIDHVPVEFNIWLFLLINAGTFIASVLMLVGPSYLISKIHPAKSIQFE
ncbi:ABC transporter permease [uncultured Bacteroides sp.]|uniref:ABC transporter permease n=1 Tax=uncultured Bacteroides sp. TaxID=162156 RepID=UPI002AABFF23|nr:ABC transporter permease [uncultured Bacteroides sp.]